MTYVAAGDVDETSARMLTSVLLYLRGARSANSAIKVGVDLAREASSRLRGLTLVDTRRAQEASHSESAVYADIAHRRQALLEQRHIRVRRALSSACLAADLDFDVRRVAGDPFKILPRESQFHDLVVTSLGLAAQRVRSDAERRGRELLRLLHAGVRPLMVLPPKKHKLQRVLLVYDGSDASGHAIRSFLGLELLPAADVRLLAVGANDAAARHSLRDMADYCSTRRRRLETGWVRGSVRRVLAPFAARWQADLVVLGVAHPRWPLPMLSSACDWGQLAEQGCGVFLHG
jgi:nucleotide-binding universal stress UspA family protein